MVQFKRCSNPRCTNPNTLEDGTLPISEFHKDNNRKNGLVFRCKVCIAVQNAKHYAANRDKFAAIHAEYRAANKDKIIISNAKYYVANKERITTRVVKYRAANKEKIAALYAKYYAANKEKEAARAVKYRAANKDKIAISAAQYRDANKDKITKYRRAHPIQILINRIKTFERHQAGYDNKKRQKRAGLILRGAVHLSLEFPEKMKAAGIFIEKPDHCAECDKKLPRRQCQGHHPLYPKPLDVIWCCQKCHSKLDATRRANVTG